MRQILPSERRWKIPRSFILIRIKSRTYLKLNSTKTVRERSTIYLKIVKVISISQNSRSKSIVGWRITKRLKLFGIRWKLKCREETSNCTSTLTTVWTSIYINVVILSLNWFKVLRDVQIQPNYMILWNPWNSMIRWNLIPILFSKLRNINRLMIVTLNYPN